MTTQGRNVADRARRKGPRIQGKVRYAVVGLGHIAQSAVLPAFAHARESAELVAVISGDEEKRRAMQERYGLAHAWSYDEYDAALGSGTFDAVYLAIPNDKHRDFAVRAARAGIHVLCEKPMEVTVPACEEMIRAAEEHDVRLMVGYRLHFEPANLEAMEIVRSKRLGEPRIMNSVFCMQVREGNTRLSATRGGGPLYDIGIYCINTARNVFQAEPLEVFAMSASGRDDRFEEVDEMVTAVLRFPDDRLATFVCSFGAHHAGSFRVIGTKGELRVDPAFTYASEHRYQLTVDGRTRTKEFEKRDQFAPELAYFSDCVRTGKEPEPDGREGLADVRVIEALHQSIRTGRPVWLGAMEIERAWPTLEQGEWRPPVEEEPDLIGVEPPTA